MKRTLSVILLVSSFLLFFNNCKSNDKYTLSCKQTTDNNWFYEIYSGEKLLIKQKNIPALKVPKKFKNKQDASKVGLLVLDKIKNGDSPSVSIKELKELNLEIEN